MKLSLHAELAFEFTGPTDALLQIEAAILPEQEVESAHIELPRTEHFARMCGHDGIGERIWLRHCGKLPVTYDATVRIERLLADVASLQAVPPHLLPEPAVQYLLASRYCPSDEFQDLAEAEFGGTQGGARIAAIRDWIHDHIAYVPGSSTAATGALQTYVARKGVCRDFAHLLITLARAGSIPARFASVYATGVEPQDFHAVAEVFLEGAWHLVDATGMAEAGAMAKIGVGRDAADTSFLTSFGPALLRHKAISVEMA